MPLGAASHVRIARPSRDLDAAYRFWVRGLGLRLLYREAPGDTPGHHALLMAGWPDAGWHLELTQDAAGAVEPRPTGDDLLAQ